MYFEEKIDKIYDAVCGEKKSLDKNQRIVTIVPDKKYHIRFITGFLQMKEIEIRSRIRPIPTQNNMFLGSSVLFLMNGTYPKNNKIKKIRSSSQLENEMFQKLRHLNNG